MSTPQFSELPDPVYGSAHVLPNNPKSCRVAATTNKAGTLLHAHIGGVYVAMSERNWRHLVNQLQTLEVPAETVTHTIRMNDADGTATIETTRA